MGKNVPNFYEKSFGVICLMSIACPLPQHRYPVPLSSGGEGCMITPLPLARRVLQGRIVQLLQQTGQSISRRLDWQYVLCFPHHINEPHFRLIQGPQQEPCPTFVSAFAVELHFIPLFAHH